MTIPTISPKELAAACKDCTVELIDVRTPAEFEAVRVPFAKLMPLDKLDPKGVMSSRNGNSNQPLYVICRSGARAKQACEQFRAAGFDNVICVEGGTLAWEQSGLELIKGRKMLPLDRQMRIVIGSVIVLSAVLAWLVHPAFVALCGLSGAGLIFAGVTDICPLSMALARMPWNQRGVNSCAVVPGK